MLLKAYNKSLIQDREKTYLTSPIAVAGTSANVKAVDSNAWADNDYIIIGHIGAGNAEVLQINGAVSDGTSLTIDNNGSGGSRYAHAANEPVYRIDYNRVEFNRNTTDTTTGVTVLTTIEIQPDDSYTRYEDGSNTTGFGFLRFNNQTTGGFSSYSDGVNYEGGEISSSTDPRTLWSIRKKVRSLLDLVDDPTESGVTDEEIDQAINDKQRDIAHLRFWPFYEVTRSFSSVANRSYFTVPGSVNKIHTLAVDSQPLAWLDRTEWELLHWDTSRSGDPTHFSVFENELHLYPIIASAATSTALNGALSATATTAVVTSNSGFRMAPTVRIIIDDEVLVCDATSGTTQFTGCRRGQEGTTAASHSNAATVTERDVVYTAHIEPSDLIDTQDRTLIPEPEVLAYGSAADLALSLEKETLHDRLNLKFVSKLKELEDKYGKKQSAKFPRIKDKDETVLKSSRLVNPNEYPTDIGT